jgi:hypothetical protein
MTDESTPDQQVWYDFTITQTSGFAISVKKDGQTLVTSAYFHRRMWRYFGQAKTLTYWIVWKLINKSKESGWITPTSLRAEVKHPDASRQIMSPNVA